MGTIGSLSVPALILSLLITVTSCTGDGGSNTDGCSLVTLDGDSLQSLMLTNVSEATDLLVAGVGCELTVFLVGGGWAGDGAGGGSGYLQYGSVVVEPGTVITAQVGQGGVNYNTGYWAQPTTLAFSSGETVTAEPGEYGNGNGGNGYCGGGGYGSSETGDGGTNGGNGQDSFAGAGGRGTGENVAAYSLRTWSLTPGAGGRHTGTLFGGGGGGVLVDGAGPDTETDYQGRGYGGGGSGPHHGSGLPGVILMEIASV